MIFKRMLLIDDEPDVAAYIQAVAEDCGFEVRATHRAQEFMTTYESFRPNVISLDLAIPGVDGIELLRYLADKECTARIFIASGFGGNVLSAAERLGAARGLKMAGIIEKPMRPTELRKLFNGLQLEV